MPAFQSLTGLRFGRWTVLSRAEDYIPGVPQWHCRCECGKEGIVRAGILKAGQSRSCGCLNRDVQSAKCTKRNRTHGLSHTPTYKVWCSIIDRCYTPSSGAFHKYGARGITVCDRWRHNYPAFLADMGEKPPGLTIDRLDNTKGYEPGNVRWATMAVQQNNRGNNVVLEHAGRSLTLMQWSRVLGLDRHTIRRRLAAGATPAEALSTVRHGRGGKPLAK